MTMLKPEQHLYECFDHEQQRVLCYEWITAEEAEAANALCKLEGKPFEWRLFG
jgi:hypothetical protein